MKIQTPESKLFKLIDEVQQIHEIFQSFSYQIGSLFKEACSLKEDKNCVFDIRTPEKLIINHATPITVLRAWLDQYIVAANKVNDEDPDLNNFIYLIGCLEFMESVLPTSYHLLPEFYDSVFQLDVSPKFVSDLASTETYMGEENPYGKFFVHINEVALERYQQRYPKQLRGLVLPEVNYDSDEFNVEEPDREEEEEQIDSEEEEEQEEPEEEQEEEKQNINARGRGRYNLRPIKRMKDK